MSEIELRQLQLLRGEPTNERTAARAGPTVDQDRVKPLACPWRFCRNPETLTIVRTKSQGCQEISL